jgi:hypothetical protein
MPKFRVIFEKTDLIIHKWDQLYVTNIVIEMPHIK